MKSKVMTGLALLMASGMAYAEGGCPQGQTPMLYGSVWGCAPGGTDGPGYAPSDYSSYGSTPQSADDGLIPTFGAVAFGTKPGQGTFYWFSGPGETWEDATSQALTACSQDGGQDCTIGEKVINGYLGVAVSDDGSLFAGYGGTEENLNLMTVGKCTFRGHKQGCRLLKTQNYLQRRK